MVSHNSQNAPEALFLENIINKICIFIRVKILSKISALLLLILLSGSAVGAANPIPASKAGASRHSSIQPAHSPDLFAIHQQEKTEVNLLDRFPKANSADHLENHTCGYQLVESAVQRQTALYLQFYKALGRSLVIKELIFPFHSHW